MKKPKDMCMISIIDTVNKDSLVSPIEERLRSKALGAVIMNFDVDDINGYDKVVSALIGLGSYTCTKEVLS